MFVNVSNHGYKNASWIRWHIHRPDRFNALGTSIAQELLARLKEIQSIKDQGVLGLVITAESVIKKDQISAANDEFNSKIWIAGGDLKELAVLTDRQAGRAYAESMRRFCEGLESLPFPVFTIVDGHAIGGGVELALAGDIRLATKGSQFEFRQLVVGLATGYGSAQKLVNLVGKSLAQRWLYFAERISAKTARDTGLIHQIIDSASYEDIQRAIEPILNLEPRAFVAQKRMLKMASDHPSGNGAWSDEIFSSIWFNATHRKTLEKFIDGASNNADT